ncbi:hypothetical protein [Aliagarivorans marinus]|uniref:hypothetical protein n=1 Tax=Aliagarivorans marinus TaxID=561965 RepID=UPI0004795ABC|nr:hypothetical protein [Aliagarivorans marinus]
MSSRFNHSSTDESLAHSPTLAKRAKKPRFFKTAKAEHTTIGLPSAGFHLLIGTLSMLFLSLNYWAIAHHEAAYQSLIAHFGGHLIWMLPLLLATTSLVFLLFDRPWVSFLASLGTTFISITILHICSWLFEGEAQSLQLLSVLLCVIPLVTFVALAKPSWFGSISHGTLCCVAVFFLLLGAQLIGGIWELHTGLWILAFLCCIAMGICWGGYSEGEATLDRAIDAAGLIFSSFFLALLYLFYVFFIGAFLKNRYQR